MAKRTLDYTSYNDVKITQTGWLSPASAISEQDFVAV